MKLKNQSPGVQFAVFFGLSAGMFIVNIIVTEVFFGNIGDMFKDAEPSKSLVNQFKWGQLISSIITFIMPAFIYGHLSDEKPLQYLGIKPGVRVPFLGITLLLLVAVMPLVMVVGEWNQHAHFGVMHELIQKIEDMSEKLMTRFLVMDSVGDLLINLFIIAVLPAIGEEMFFRGALQNILERWTKRGWIAIALSSLFFAFFHFTFLKFLPIFILGVLLGTLFYVTRNLWYSIFFHFLNNAMAVLASYYAQRNEFMKKLADDEMQLSAWTGLVSLLVTLGLFFFLRKRNPYQPLENTWTPGGFNDYLNTNR